MKITQFFLLNQKKGGLMALFFWLLLSGLGFCAEKAENTAIFFGKVCHAPSSNVLYLEIEKSSGLTTINQTPLSATPSENVQKKFKFPCTVVSIFGPDHGTLFRLELFQTKSNYLIITGILPDKVRLLVQDQPIQMRHLFLKIPADTITEAGLDILAFDKGSLSG